VSFFDKKQDVIDIKLTQFGKNLLARGFFRPVYYKFFDDGILYNAEAADITEEQNASEDRIQETQRMRTQHLVAGVETRFDQNENLINSGSREPFMEIKRRQDPIIADKILKYSLEDSLVNSPDAPSFNINILDSSISSSADNVSADGISLAIPQLNISSSYALVEDRRKEIDIPEDLVEYQNYMDLLTNDIEFLDKSSIKIREENITIDIEELNVNDYLENFEIEIYEVDEQGKLIRLETEEEVKKYFDIKVDDALDEIPPSDVRSDRFRREEE